MSFLPLYLSLPWTFFWFFIFYRCKFCKPAMFYRTMYIFAFLLKVNVYLRFGRTRPLGIMCPSGLVQPEQLITFHCTAVWLQASSKPAVSKTRLSHLLSVSNIIADTHEASSALPYSSAHDTLRSSTSNIVKLITPTYWSVGAGLVSSCGLPQALVSYRTAIYWALSRCLSTILPSLRDPAAYPCGNLANGLPKENTIQIYYNLSPYLYFFYEVLIFYLFLFLNFRSFIVDVTATMAVFNNPLIHCPLD